jgi:hypothetical protein
MYTDQDIANLVTRVQQLEIQQASRPATGLPNFGIISKNFLTRAFAAWGLNFVAGLIISIAISCLMTILGLVVGVKMIDVIRQWLQGMQGTLPSF